MNKKIIYILMGLILISSVLVVNARLEVPQENRDCMKWGVSGQMFMCFVSSDGSYAKWFNNYQEMKSYYTPQLREVNLSGGQTQTFTAGKIIIQGTTGELSYQYVKGN